MTGSRPLPDGYEAVRELGSGGFGEVVLARHIRLGRLVAVKRIHAYTLAAPDALERFRREALVLAGTTHPSVVKVYDFLRTADEAVLVMEYVPGNALSDLLEDGPLPAADTLVILRDVADALSAAAEHGVVHRDVKPANVFVMPDGHAKLGDFGLARIVSDASVFRTAVGQASGTPAYFPPELSLGANEPDARSDAYSFAVMAYEMLTGSQPFTAEGAIAVIAAHWTQTPASPVDLVPGFPAPAAEALLRAMAKDPAERILPIDLVARLVALRTDAWPEPAPRSGRQQADSRRRRSDPTMPGPVPPPPTGTAAPGGGPPRRGRRGRLAAAAAVTVVAAGAAVAVVLIDGPGELRVEAVSVSADPASGEGSCPGTEYVFTAVVATNGEPGSIDVRWTRPDGRTTDGQLVEVSAGRREVTARLTFSVSGSQPMDGRAVVHLRSPAQDQAVSPRISYVC